MTDDLHLSDGGLTPLANLHDTVAEGLAQLTGARAPVSADVAQSFGTIAFGVHTALDTASQSRLGALGATRTAGDAICALLRESDRAYGEADRAGADGLRSAQHPVAQS